MNAFRGFKIAVWKGVLSLRQNTKTCFDVNDKELACLKDYAPYCAKT